MATRSYRGGLQLQLVSLPSLSVNTLADLRASMITYPNYKFYFPIKALGMYKQIWGNEEIL